MKKTIALSGLFSLGTVSAFCLCFCTAQSSAPLQAEEAEEMTDAVLRSALGKPIKNFTLKDYRGKEYALNDFRDSKVVVVAFLGVECPLAKLYGLRLGKLHRQFAAQGVTFIGINANCMDSVTELAAFADRHNIGFPLLKDVGNKVADQFKAHRTPEVFVLDEKRVIRYRGRIDDQYGIGYIRDTVSNPCLERAINELLSGKPVSVPFVKAEGCIIARLREQNPRSKVTYAEHIAPILQKRCVECHRPGEIAPFALTEYSEVQGWAEMIREVIHDGRMPPWHADPKHGRFANDRRLSQREIALIDQWVINGAPPGDLKKVPPLPPATKGWQLPRQPDLIIPMRSTPYTVPAEGVFRREGERRGIPYKHFIVDPGFTEDKWIQAAEVVPGNRAVVHHILVIVKPPGKGLGRGGIGGGEFLAGYVPGLRARPAPPGTAKFVPAGSKLIFQMHYTPVGSEQKDLSKIGLIFADPKTVQQVIVTTRAANRGFEIPPHAASHTVEATTGSLPFDVQLLSFMPHMHLRGKSFLYESQYPDGTKEVLLSVPQYDFNWQTRYELAQPKKLPAGTKIHCVATFDNSRNNLNNPDPDRAVRWGDQTWDEMMIGYFDILVPRQQFERTWQAEKRRRGKSRLDEILARLDANGDGKLDKTEIPPRLQRLFRRFDFNKDGFVTRKELQNVSRLFRR